MKTGIHLKDKWKNLRLIEEHNPDIIFRITSAFREWEEVKVASHASCGERLFQEGIENLRDVIVYEYVPFLCL